MDDCMMMIITMPSSPRGAANLTPRAEPQSPVTLPSVSLQAPPSLRTNLYDVYLPSRFLTDIPAADADFLALPSFEDDDRDDKEAADVPFLPRLAPRLQPPY